MQHTRSNDLQRGSLWASLLLSPIVCTASATFLRPMRLIHGTPLESGLYVALGLLPMIGVAGIWRYPRLGLQGKVLGSMVYLVSMSLLSFTAAVILGCSWAGACF
jgi:hypothetical protein